MGFVEVLRNYCVEELGSIYLYLPVQSSAVDQEGWAWLQALRLVDAVRAGPYRLSAEDRVLHLKDSHPLLFAKNPECFDVYRLDRSRFPKLLDLLPKSSR